MNKIVRLILLVLCVSLVQAAVGNFYDDYIKEEEIKGVQTYAHSYYLSHDVPTEKVVMLIHGYTSNPTETRAMGAYLFKQGFDVFGVRMNGHGTSPDDLKRTEWAEWIVPVKKTYQFLRKEYKELYLFGISTGSLAALNIAAENKVEGIVCVSTFLKSQTKSIYFGSLIYPVSKLFGYDWGYVDVDIPKERQNITYTRNPIDATMQLLDFLNHTKRLLSKVTAPILILHSSTDDVAAPESAEFLYANVSSLKKKIVWTEDEHSFLIDPKPDLYKLINDFYKKTEDVISIDEIDTIKNSSAMVLPNYAPAVGISLISLYNKKFVGSNDDELDIYSELFQNGDLYLDLTLDNQGYKLNYKLDYKTYHFYGLGANSLLADLDTYRPLNHQIGIFNTIKINDSLSSELGLVYNHNQYVSWTSDKSLNASSLISKKHSQSMGLNADLKWDTLNSITNPSYGSLYKLKLETYPSFLGNETDYSKMKGELKVYREVLSKHVLAYQIQAQAMMGGPTVHDYPYLGDYYSARSIAWQRYRGKVSFFHSLEYRFPTGVSFGEINVDSNIYLESGSVYNSLSSMSLQNQLLGYGFGLKFVFPSEFIIGIDSGFSNEGMALNLGFGQSF